jgi:predicted transglutaminase-like cysteine proteinase
MIPRLAFVAAVLCAMTTGPKAQTDSFGHNFPTDREYMARPMLGWTQFCATNEGKYDCDVEPVLAEVVEFSQHNMNIVAVINNKVNRKVKLVTDLDHWGVAERWSYPTDGKGDCEDYVLEKRRLLMAAGVPRSALLITVVLDAQQEGHAVLTLVTDRGDYVLDNKVLRIVPWDKTGYQFFKRQSRENPNIWVRLDKWKTAKETTSRN